ncbi:MAG TPA: hypothetical protein VMD30_00615, partial [Tepidisphaeraceae bacterium]|nr:hypothetical protein [Tepidisphaeraceae bacterium]
MIKFPCICGKNFALEDDQAGSEFQCPQCGRLVTAPTLGDIQSLGPDGTYKVNPPPAVDDPARAAELHYYFQRDPTDSSGEEIDRRNTLAQWMQVGDEPRGSDEQHIPRPRYDPETGQLVEPLDLMPEEPIAAKPVGPPPSGRATLSYARPVADRPREMSPARILLELLMPQNIVVILIIMFFHTLLIGALVAAAMGVLLAIPVAAGLFCAVVGHYALVLEETSLEEKDDLPRPLRWFNFYDDIWRPFFVTGLAVLYAWWPALLATYIFPDNRHAVVWVALFLLGAAIFPAALVTTATANLIGNLRPDRIFQVIGISGFDYWAVAGAMLTGIVLYGVGIAGCGIATFRLFSGANVSSLPIFLR